MTSANATLLDLHRRHVWPPYTSNEAHAERVPLEVASAEGPWLIASDGRRYLDGNGSWWTNNLGHAHPRLLRALDVQAKALAHCSLAGILHEPAVRLAAELTTVAPAGLSRVFFSDNGSTAVEVALKIALQYWAQNGQPKRTTFVALSGAFHGDTFGAMAVSGLAPFRSTFTSVLLPTLRAPDPAHVGSWDEVVSWIERTLEDSGDRVAAVIVEPRVQAAAGMRLWPSAALTRLREVVSRFDTFLVADEVFTGFGRTGTLWACEQAHVVPDMLCLAKGITGGLLPFAATLVSDRIYGGFSGGATRAFMHGHTYCGNPLGAALAREVLAIYRDEDVLGQAARNAKTIAQAFEDLAGFPGVARTRALGMVAAADLGEGGYAGRMGWAVYDQALERGAYLRPLGDTVYIAPALNIDSASLERLLDVVTESVRAVVA